MKVYGILLEEYDTLSVRVYKYELSKINGVFVFYLAPSPTEFGPAFWSYRLPYCAVIKKSQLTSFIAEDGIYLYFECDADRKDLMRFRLDECRYCCVLLDGFVKDLTHDISWITQSQIS